MVYISDICIYTSICIFSITITNCFLYRACSKVFQIQHNYIIARVHIVYIVVCSTDPHLKSEPESSAGKLIYSVANNAK